MFVAARRPLARPSGLTLVEVILVLSLLVIVASVSMPYLNKLVFPSHLNGATDILDALTRGRLTAMQSGEAQAFRCEPKGCAISVGGSQ